MVAIGLVVGVAEHGIHVAGLAEEGKVDNAIGVLAFDLAEYRGFVDGEGGGIDADPETEREDCHQSEAGMFRQHTYAEAEILGDGLGQGEEVDLIMESSAGQIVGIEVKASTSVDSKDFKGLKLLADAIGPRFHRGLVIYTGQETIPFGKQMHAVPIDTIWRAMDYD